MRGGGRWQLYQSFDLIGRSIVPEWVASGWLDATQAGLASTRWTGSQCAPAPPHTQQTQMQGHSSKDVGLAVPVWGRPRAVCQRQQIGDTRPLYKTVQAGSTWQHLWPWQGLGCVTRWMQKGDPRLRSWAGPQDTASGNSGGSQASLGRTKPRPLQTSPRPARPPDCTR